MILMRKWKKAMILTIMGIGMIALTIVIVYKIKVPPQETKEDIRYEYTFKPEIKYTVHMKENDFFDNLIQEEGLIYFKNLLEYIQIEFSTNYQANKEVSLDMEYQLFASVIGYNTTREERTNYWNKDFTLSDQKTYHIDSDRLEKSETMKIYLEKYDDFVVKANNELGVNFTTELNIAMVGSIVANAPEGSLVTPINLNLVIPLQTSVLEITEKGSESSSDKITSSKVIELPVNKGQIILLGMGNGILVLMFIVILLFVTEPFEEDIIRSKIKSILNNHGSRMVALKTKPRKNFNQIHLVTQIKDLFVVSDEVRKPIYYIIDEQDIVEDYSFYCELEDDLYVFKVELSEDDQYYGHRYEENYDMREEPEEEEREGRTKRRISIML